MLDVMRKVKKNIHILRKLLPLLSFVVPFLVLYFLYPDSFEATWKGRTFYVFFLWLVSLEIILNWEKLRTNKVNKLRSIRAVAFIVAVLLPTIYVLIANFLGLNTAIVDLARQANIQPWWANLMPLSIEYLVFATIFAIITFIAYNKEGLADFSMSIFLLGAIGMIYIIDNFYPNGTFTPFQIFVPTTAKLAANVLNYMGYQTMWLPPRDGMPTMIAWDSQGNPSSPFSIAWPCSGVESLLIYTVTILLFLKKSGIPWKQKTIYFIIGGIVTYFINVLRIVTIYVISINGGDVSAFHNYYGQLYSIIWIISYPLIIIGSRALWGNIKNRKLVQKRFLNIAN